MDRTIHFGDDAADARYRIQDTSSTGGDFVLAEDLDGGTVLLEYDYSAGEFVSRGPVNLNGNDITDAGSVSADTLEATDSITGPAGNSTTDISSLGANIYVTEPSEPQPSVGGEGDLWYQLNEFLSSLTSPPSWTYTTGGAVESGIAISNGTAVVGSDDNNVYGLALSDGTEQWSFTTGSAVESGIAISNGTAVAASYDGIVYGLALSDGTEQWSFTTGSAVVSGIAISNGTAVVGSNDNTVYGLALSDGTEQWTFATGGFMSSGVAISDNTAVIGSDDDNVYGLALSDGTEQWSFTTGNDISSGVAISDNTVVVGSNDANVYGLEGQTAYETPKLSDGTNWIDKL